MIEVWCDNPLANYKTIAEKAGISEMTFYRYRKDEEFMKKYHEECRRRFSSMEAKAMRVLDTQLENGSLQAAKYLLDGLGYSATQKVEVSGQNDINITIGE